MQSKDGRKTRVRCFLGFKVDALKSLSPLRDELAAITENSESKLRPTTDNNLHLTLRFFGAIDQELLGPVIQLTEQLAARHSAIKLQLQGIGLFKNAIWIGVKPDSELTALAEECGLAFNLLGLTSLDSKFIPHITVARFGKNARLPLSDLVDKFRDRDWGEFPAESISLFKSETLPEGANYTVLSSAPLSKV